MGIEGIPSSDLLGTPRRGTGLRYHNVHFWVAFCAISAYAMVWTAALTCVFHSVFEGRLQEMVLLQYLLNSYDP